MKHIEDSFFNNVFLLEKNKIIDTKQIEELKRWYLLDFEAIEEYQNDNYVSKSNLISVCGCGRSGTTLLRVMLDSHPEIYAGPESLLFLPIEINIKDLAFKFDFLEQEIANILSRSKSRSKFIDQFKEMVLNRDGNKNIWCDKTARNVHCLDYIFNHFHKSKLIHVLRDPRDVIASLRTHKKRKLLDGNITDTGYLMPITLCIDRWNKSMEDALPYRKKTNYIEVRYEDLIEQTEHELKKICNFIGVKFNMEMLNFHSYNGSTRDHNKFIQNIEATKPLTNTSIGRYKTIFNLDEIKLIEDRTQINAELFGYKY